MIENGEKYGIFTSVSDLPDGPIKQIFSSYQPETNCFVRLIKKNVKFNSISRWGKVYLMSEFILIILITIQLFEKNKCRWLNNGFWLKQYCKNQFILFS